MDLGLILALVSATAILVAIPGPNVALIVANTIAYGFRFGAMTVFVSERSLRSRTTSNCTRFPESSLTL